MKTLKSVLLSVEKRLNSIYKSQIHGVYTNKGSEVMVAPLNAERLKFIESSLFADTQLGPGGASLFLLLLLILTHKQTNNVIMF